jgi:hypothetical protein
VARKKPVTVKIDSGQLVRELARERVGPVKPAREIVPKAAKKKPKHKKEPVEEEG